MHPTDRGSPTPARPRRNARWSEGRHPPEHLADRLRAAGLRPTPIRCDVLAVLEGDAGEAVPFLAADVYRRVARPGFALANVYRILGELEAAGLVERSVPEVRRACVFSVRGVTQPGHLACVRCHAVEAVRDEWVLSRLNTMAKARGLAVARVSWRMLGLCRACAATTQGEPAAD